MVNPEIDSDLAAVGEAGIIAQALPYLMAELDRMEKTLETRVAMRVDSDEGLSPDFAVEAWMEKMAYRRLRNSLTKRVQLGRVAGERLEPYMNEGITGEGHG